MKKIPAPVNFPDFLRETFAYAISFVRQFNARRAPGHAIPVNNATGWEALVDSVSGYSIRLEPRQVLVARERQYGFVRGKSEPCKPSWNIHLLDAVPGR